MRKIADIVLIAGFLIVDFLLFHDLFKPGESYTVAEYLIGALSVLVFITSARSLLK
ncbi:MAG: hypothetical protein JO019_02245 [Candidatus Kaiserbacteria bacterium]|nr:hypothetical protein [Candidatus Kaiserbacteria bacterium]